MKHVTTIQKNITVCTPGLSSEPHTNSWFRDIHHRVCVCECVCVCVCVCVYVCVCATLYPPPLFNTAVIRNHATPTPAAGAGRWPHCVPWPHYVPYTLTAFPASSSLQTPIKVHFYYFKSAFKVPKVSNSKSRKRNLESLEAVTRERTRLSSIESSLSEGHGENAMRPVCCEQTRCVAPVLVDSRL